MARIRQELFDAFGQEECEKEVLVMKDGYEEIFFAEAPFNEPAISEHAYLIIGRRGSGKTALAHFFTFQKTIPDARCVDVNEPEVYREVIKHLAQYPSNESREFIIRHLVEVWEAVVWLTIVEYLRSELDAVAEVLRAQQKHSKLSINGVFERIKDLIVPPDHRATEENLAKLNEEGRLDRAKAAIFNTSADRPLIIAIDTLEQYDVGNESMMNAVAALIEFAAMFHTKYAHRGLHIKVFVSGEVLPFLEEGVLLNTLKGVKHPVHLLWRPKDLLRLISWRLFKRLQKHSLLLPESASIKRWDDSKEVYEKMWVPYFGRWVTNLRGERESTFSYMLRHTQMRPRQLIVLCNSVANRALEEGNFPRLHEHHLRDGVKAAEQRLSTEIINAYSSVYQHAGRIAEALSGCDNLFPTRELDRRAKETAAHWPSGQYSLYNFRRFLVELGIIGRVKRRNDESGYVDADFEYSLEGRLSLSTQDECVIHPMFYQRLNINVKDGIKVMPFSSDRSVSEHEGP
jgi:hypothetical protein